MTLAACGGADGSPRATSARTDVAPPATRAEADAAEALGRRAFQLLDQVASYRSSHRGRLPASVAQLGIDSLTPDMVMRVRPRNDSAIVQVAFRRPDGRPLAWCEATPEALEQASLNAGAFGVWCARSAGTADSFTVGGLR